MIKTKAINAVKNKKDPIQENKNLDCFRDHVIVCKTVDIAKQLQPKLSKCDTCLIRYVQRIDNKIMFDTGSCISDSRMKVKVIEKLNRVSVNI